MSMSREAKKRILNLLCGFLVMTGGLYASQQQSDQEHRLLIHLRPVTQVTEANVRLADIATFFRNGKLCTLKDLSEDWQRKLRRVEVARLSNPRPAAILSRENINLRMRVLGLKNDQFELVGSDVATVSMAQKQMQKAMMIPAGFASLSKAIDEPMLEQQPDVTALSDLSIEQAIREELASQFSVKETDLQVRLLTSVISPDLPSLKDVIDPVIQVTAPVKMPYGRKSLLVRILDGQRIALMQSVTVDIRLRQALLLARRPVSVGTKLDASMLTEEIRFTDRQYDQLVAEDVIGMMAARPFRSSEIIAWANLRDSSSIPAALSKPLVNARDAVKVVASHKTLRIAVSAAQALESGRKGQLIRVRNIQSGKVFSARVVQSGEVQLIL
ncbi:MAG: flagellar basal body P-ring formation chaperone FlgA [Fuerstiella sp.]